MVVVVGPFVDNKVLIRVIVYDRPAGFIAIIILSGEPLVFLPVQFYYGYTMGL